MITVHHLENSRSQRVLWLLEELELDYEVKRYDRDPETSLAPAALESVHPLGKSPVITDGDITVAETGALIEYVIERYGEGRLIPPAGTPERLEYTYWLHAAEGSMMPLMVMSLIVGRIETAPVPFFLKPVTKGIAGKVKAGYLEPNITRQLKFMNAELGQRAWFAGDEFTAADVQMSFPVEAAGVRASLDAYPNLQDFLRRIHARPAYQRALERGGPYNLLGE